MNDTQPEVGSYARSLSELQRVFQAAVMKNTPAAPSFIAEPLSGSAKQRFAVYTEAYRLRLVEALAVDYPALKAWLGNEAFDRMGRAYVDVCPSRQCSIRGFGARLPRFLRDTLPYDSQPAVQELAAFEWALSEAFDAADHHLVAQQQLAAVQPERWPRLRLQLHASLRTLQLLYNTAERWQALQRAETPPELALRAEPQPWIVWRHDLKLLFRPLSGSEAWALDAFRGGRCFAEVCEGLCDWLEEADVAVRAAGYLQGWLSDGWVVGIHTPET